MILKHIYKSDRWPDFRVGCRSQVDCEQLVRYLLRPAANPIILRNDFAGDSPEEIGDELAALHQQQTIWAYHVVASHPKDEAGLWNPQAEQRIVELQNRVGITQGFWVRHDGHWHGLLLAMKPNGGTVRLGTRNEHGEPVPVAMALREMAQQWEDQTPGCQKTGRGGRNLDLSRDSIAAAERQYLAKEAPTPIPKKLLLKAEIDRLVALSRRFCDLHDHAQRAGVSIAYKRDDAGKILGISFSKDDVSLRGREAGHSYTQLLSLYEQHTQTNTPITPSRRLTRVARRTFFPHRSEDRGRVAAGVTAADPNAGGDPHLADHAGRTNTDHPRWTQAAIRALSPRGTTVIDLLCELSVVAHRVLKQNDYRRRFFRPHKSISI